VFHPAILGYRSGLQPFSFLWRDRVPGALPQAGMVRAVSAETHDVELRPMRTSTI
jgi:hypothetical protein